MTQGVGRSKYFHFFFFGNHLWTVPKLMTIRLLFVTCHSYFKKNFNTTSDQILTAWRLFISGNLQKKRKFYLVMFNAFNWIRKYTKYFFENYKLLVLMDLFVWWNNLVEFHLIFDSNQWIKSNFIKCKYLFRLQSIQK